MHTDTTDRTRRHALGPALLERLRLHTPDDFERLVLDADQGHEWRCARRDGSATYWLAADAHRCCRLVFADGRITVDIGRHSFQLDELPASAAAQWRLHTRAVCGSPGPDFITALAEALHVWD